MRLKEALLHNTAWKIIGMAFTFTSNILIVRLLGVEDSGSFFYLVAMLTLVITAMKLGIENGLVYLSSRYPAETGALLYFLLPLLLIQSLVVFFVVRYLLQDSYSVSHGWAMVFILSNIFFYYITALYQAKKMYISINVINTVIAGLQTILLLVVIFNNSEDMIPGALVKNVFIILTAATVVQMVLLTVWFCLKNKDVRKPVKLSANFIRQLFRYSGLNYIITILFFLMTRADFFFVEKYCDETTFGNYTQVAKFGQMALVLPALLGGVIFPYSAGRQRAIEDQVSFLCRLLGIFFIILLAGALLFGSQLFPLLLGNGFVLVYKGFLASFVGVYSMGISILLLSYFEGKNRQQLVLSAYAISIVMLVTGDLLLVPRYGYLAAAGVFSFSNLAGMLLLLHYFSKRSAFSWRKVLVFSRSDLKKIKL
jgi:O-antigen/teichoic acid export membrane protein